MFRDLFLDHPETVGETYGEHAVVALSFAVPLFLAACACLIHALVPGLFKTTGSTIIRGLYQRMVTHRRIKPLAAPAFEALSFDAVI